MKNIFFTLIIVFVLVGCSTEETGQLTSEYTGRETVYTLFQASGYAISGTVTLKERVDQTTDIEVNLSGTDGDIFHPVHLHYGDLSIPDADIAAQLTPVFGKNGTSKTTLKVLGDETPISYGELLKMNASIKVHLDNGLLGQDIVLAGGNIGSNPNTLPTNGRISIAVCKNY